MLSVQVKGDPSATEATEAVRQLRSQLIPEAFAATEAEVLVGGTSSENIDYFDSVIDPAPYVIVRVPPHLRPADNRLPVDRRRGTAVLLNLLSVGAAYGLLVLVFQEGSRDSPGSRRRTRSRPGCRSSSSRSVRTLNGLPGVPASRIRERFDESGDTTDAVTFGVGSTARIITGAALIIVAVFAGFARGDLIMFQQMGFGVAIALLLDATSSARCCSRRDEAPRRLELVPAALAGVDSSCPHRRSECRGEWALALESGRG